ncbi:hypothetical protein VOLCADRAFT_99647, partial [Volvox carteri f. nagariensis]
DGTSAAAAHSTGPPRRACISKLFTAHQANRPPLPSKPPLATQRHQQPSPSPLPPSIAPIALPPTSGMILGDSCDGGGGRNCRAVHGGHGVGDVEKGSSDGDGGGGDGEGTTDGDTDDSKGRSRRRKSGGGGSVRGAGNTARSRRASTGGDAANGAAWVSSSGGGSARGRGGRGGSRAAAAAATGKRAATDAPPAFKISDGVDFSRGGGVYGGTDDGAGGGDGSVGVQAQASKRHRAAAVAASGPTGGGEGPDLITLQARLYPCGPGGPPGHVALVLGPPAALLRMSAETVLVQLPAGLDLQFSDTYASSRNVHRYVHISLFSHANHVVPLLLIGGSMGDMGAIGRVAPLPGVLQGLSAGGQMYGGRGRGRNGVNNTSDEDFGDDNDGDDDDDDDGTEPGNAAAAIPTAAACTEVVEAVLASGGLGLDLKGELLRLRHAPLPATAMVVRIDAPPSGGGGGSVGAGGGGKPRSAAVERVFKSCLFASQYVALGDAGGVPGALPYEEDVDWDDPYGAAGDEDGGTVGEKRGIEAAAGDEENCGGGGGGGGGGGKARGAGKGKVRGAAGRGDSGSGSGVRGRGVSGVAKRSRGRKVGAKGVPKRGKLGRGGGGGGGGAGRRSGR